MIGVLASAEAWTNRLLHKKGKNPKGYKIGIREFCNSCNS